MARQIPKRTFVAGAVQTAALMAVAPGYAADGPKGFDFLVLGDMHLDRIDHHDMDWMQREKPTAISQCEVYSRITQETTPRLLAELRRQIEPRVCEARQVVTAG